MVRYVKQITIDQETITIEFNDFRKLTASIGFFKFVRDKVAKENLWNLWDLPTTEDFVIASGGSSCFPTEKKTIWFQTKHLHNGCAITTVWYWYMNPDKLGQKITGQKLPNNQKVSDNHIYLL